MFPFLPRLGMGAEMNRRARVTQVEIERALRAIEHSDTPMTIEIVPEEGVIRIVRAVDTPQKSKPGTLPTYRKMAL